MVHIPSMANNASSFLLINKQRIKVSITPNFESVIKIRGNNCIIE